MLYESGSVPAGFVEPPSMLFIIGHGVGILAGSSLPTMLLQPRFESSTKTSTSPSDGLLRKTIRRNDLANLNPDEAPVRIYRALCPSQRPHAARGHEQGRQAARRPRGGGVSRNQHQMEK